MADISEVKDQLDQLAPKLVKPSEIDKQAEELRKRTELPKKPGQRVRFEEMKEWIKLLSPEQSEQVDIFIYRLDPPIVRQKVNLALPNNIDVISDKLFPGGLKAFEEKYIVDTQGGGKYQLIIKNQSYKPRAGSDNMGYFECIHTVPFTVSPPKLLHIDGTGLDLNEVNWEDPKAQSFRAWANAHGFIDKECKVVEIKAKEGGSNNGGMDQVALMKMMLDFTTKMSDKDQQALKRNIGGEDALTKSMGELMLEKMKQEDPNKQMNTMTTLITAIMGMNGKKENGDSTMAIMVPMLTSMMQTQADAANKQFTLMMELLKQKNEPTEKDSDSELDKLHKLLQIAKEIKGGSAVPEKTMTESLIELGSNILPGVLNIVGNITAMNAAARGVKPVDTTVVQQPTNNMDRVNQMNKQQPTTEQPVAQLPANEAANMIAQYGPIIINKLSGEGWEFGAWVADGFGDPAAAAIVKYGPDNLLVAAKSVPQFWQQIEHTYGEEHLKKWLQSLCNYKEIMRQMEMEDQGEEKIQ